jgi:hypothetical protein
VGMEPRSCRDRRYGWLHGRSQGAVVALKWDSQRSCLASVPCRAIGPVLASPIP